MEEYIPRRNNNKTKLIIGILIGVLFISLGFIYHAYFSAPVISAESDRFVVLSKLSISDLSDQLKSGGYIRKYSVFNYFLNKNLTDGNINLGTYTISKSMNVFQIVSIFSGRPSEIQIVIPPGLRKEEIREILSEKFDWSATQIKEWNDATNDPSSDYFEGVYFPDTYLIPNDSTPTDIAKRLRAHFEEKLSPYTKDIAKQNMKWTTVIKVASLIQREAGSNDDMPIISAVIWNRLDKKMKLQIDATIQYIKGTSSGGWWMPVKHFDLSIDSPYNTYIYAGLPPHPIANPGIYAILAAIKPASTTCLYYIHDSGRNIHCATTNAEQNANVTKYLK